MSTAKLKYLRLVIFLLTLFGAFYFSVYFRSWQFEVWKTNPKEYFSGDIPMMTTHDAFGWFKTAKDFDRHVLDGGLKNVIASVSKLYSLDPFAKNYSLLSVLIALFSRLFDANFYLAGVSLIPWLASLLIIPLGIYFYRLGWPHIGILGGICGSLGYEYYTRTCVGRIDTDSLNIFFPFLIGLFIVMLDGKKSGRTYIFSALAGFSSLLFDWWYDHPAFSLIYLGVLVLQMFINRMPIKTILIGFILFCIFANPARLYLSTSDLISRFNLYVNVTNPIQTTPADNLIKDAEKTEPFIQPNILVTISETEKLDWQASLDRILTNKYLSGIGMLMFFIWLIRYWKISLTLIPPLLVGLFAFKSGRRFLMFLGPFVGLGWGFLIQLTGETLMLFIKKHSARLKKWWPIFSYAPSLILVYVFLPYTPIWTVPKPVIPPNIFAAVRKMKDVLPPQSYVWTIWDYGYLVRDVAEMNVYQDGGTQFSPLTYLMAKAYSSTDQNEIHNIISVTHEPGKHAMLLADMKDSPKLLATLRTEKAPLQSDNVYALFTENRLKHFSILYNMGEWDFKTGKGPDPQGYKRLACTLQPGNMLDCPGGKIDMAKGMIKISPDRPDQPFLTRTLVVKNGVVTRDLTYPHSKPEFNGWYLELIIKDNVIVEYILMDKRHFDTNFNQMFLLGRYDPQLFEETLNLAPTARVFKAKRTLP